MPSDVGIWDLAISINNQKIINGEESINKQKETSLIFVGNEFVCSYRSTLSIVKGAKALEKPLSFTAFLKEKKPQNKPWP